jgi:hypothetical protein
MGRRGMRTKFGWQSEKDRFPRKRDVYGRIILKWVSGK